jgi:hypothetical protein
MGSPIQPVIQPGTPSWSDPQNHWITDHYDKLLLAILILLTYGGFMWMVHWHVTTAVLAFASSTVSGLTGALIALLTGKK